MTDALTIGSERLGIDIGDAHNEVGCQTYIEVIKVDPGIVALVEFTKMMTGVTEVPYHVSIDLACTALKIWETGK